MARYQFENWMTDPSHYDVDPEIVGRAREALKGWSDAKVRRVERYLYRLSRLSSCMEWAEKIEDRKFNLYISRLTPSQLRAIQILRLTAKGVWGGDDFKAEYEGAYIQLQSIKDRKFRPDRRRGAVGEVTKYLKDLVKRYPGYSAKALYQAAVQEADSKDSPFSVESDELWDMTKNRTYSFDNFENRVSEIRNPRPKKKKPKKNPGIR